MLVSRQLTNQVDYILLSMDIPYRVSNSTGSVNNNYNGTTSALFYGFKDNPLDPNLFCSLAAGSTNFYAGSESALRQRPPISATSNSWLAIMLTSSNLAQAKADKFGFNAFKFQGDGIPPAADPDYKEIGHDPYLRNLTPKDLRRIALGMEWVREFLGPDTDFAVEAHWRYDVNDAIAMGKAIEPVKPMWIEDPVPPDNIEAMARVTHALNIPVCTGENLYGRHGFRKLIEMQATSGVHIDIPKSGGLLESKRIHDQADLYYIWTAAHNPASPLGTIASCHAAASMRNFRIHELAKYIDWWQDLVISDAPIIKDGYHTITNKPGYGVEINPDVAKAHLAPGEVWWG